MFLLCVITVDLALFQFPSVIAISNRFRLQSSALPWQDEIVNSRLKYSAHLGIPHARSGGQMHAPLGFKPNYEMPYPHGLIWENKRQKRKINGPRTPKGS